jgi:hypothetical protein
LKRSSADYKAAKDKCDPLKATQTANESAETTKTVGAGKAPVYEKK